MDTEVLEHILDGRGKPTNLSFTLLKDITENFSEYRQIGQGGFSTVYKGVLPNGDVAVKRIRNIHSINETLFYREVSSLLNIEHENVVRFLGYCASTDQIAIQKEGSKEFNYAEIRERLLCFEHISNGSLQKYITDELRGLEWNTRYGIIRGICEGLYHLHEEKKIFHMDLKPDNILLDNDMVPKITDFGLSRLDEKTKTTSEHRPGTLGYCAPEYLHHGYMSFKSDMYGLGAIIIELVTGKKVIANNNYNNVLRRWRHRWKKSGKETPLVYQQVAKCIEIGLLCQELNPSKRPFIWEIIHDIREIEGVNGQISNAYEHSFGQITPYSDDDMLGIEPLELHFPFELNNQVPCTVQLTNETDSYIAFNIENTSPLSYCTVQPQKDIMSPRSSCTIEVTMQPQGKAPDYMHHANELTVWSTKVNDCFAVEEITTNMFINEEVNVVDQVHLDVVFEAQIVLPQPSLIHCMDMPLVLGTIVSKDQVDSTQPQEASAETSENICTANDDLDGVSDDNPPVPHDKHTASEKQKMHVPPSSVSTANAAPALQAPLVIEEHWVQCDTCQKWRLLPYKSDPTILPKVWKCSMQLWLPRMNRCDVGEKETTDALNARYDIPPRVVMEEHWVQCDTCHKSRLLPYELDPTTLPKEWKCSMQQWLPGMNRCGVGEKETTDALNALYDIPPRVVMEEHWVQCDTCHKSRLLPYELDPTTLPKEWKCSMQQWLPGMNRCGVGEKETTDALNALYEIPPRVVMEEHWVQCDTCHKSRLLPYELDPTTLPKEWKCSMQQWLPGMNRCGVGEKETTNALNALYVISPPANGIPSVGASSGVATACNTFSINGHAGQSRKRKNFAGDGSALVDSSRPTQASAYSKITQPRPRIKSTVDNNHYPSERDSVSKSVDVSTEKKKSKRKNRGSYSDGGDLAERSKKLSKGKDNRERDYGESKAYKKIKK